MVGRITEVDLDKADRTFPGIADMYRALEKKPVTFLQLLWLYQSIESGLGAQAK